jgi:hypothetical protein
VVEGREVLGVYAFGARTYQFIHSGRGRLRNERFLGVKDKPPDPRSRYKDLWAFVWLLYGLRLNVLSWGRAPRPPGRPAQTPDRSTPLVSHRTSWGILPQTPVSRFARRAAIGNRLQIVRRPERSEPRWGLGGWPPRNGRFTSPIRLCGDVGALGSWERQPSFS